MARGLDYVNSWRDPGTWLSIGLAVLGWYLRRRKTGKGVGAWSRCLLIARWIGEAGSAGIKLKTERLKSAVKDAKIDALTENSAEKDTTIALLQAEVISLRTLHHFTSIGSNGSSSGSAETTPTISGESTTMPSLPSGPETSSRT